MASRNSPAIYAKLLLLMLAANGMLNVAAQAQDNAGENIGRLSTTTQFPRQQRDRGESGTVVESEFEPLDTKGSRVTNKQSGTTQTGAATAQSTSSEFWFYAADVVLFNDHDVDGYFSGIDLLFDADTYFSRAEVYAVVYLSLEGGPWNELAATDDFSIFGASADDEYVIVTELVSGYPSGSYDLLIELLDARDDTFLASFGPEDTSELAFLSLEDAERDAPQGTAIIIREQGGGALGWPMLLLLFLSRRAALRHWPGSSAGTGSTAASARSQTQDHRRPMRQAASTIVNSARQPGFRVRSD
jgi:hypothetical protein